MGKKLFVILLFILINPVPVFANHKGIVLGESIQKSLSIPATTEGPGFILPDSPLFFLDQLKQQARLLLAFSPEDKVNVYQDIAGERAAELRIMLARGDQQGIRTDLDGIADNLKAAASALSDAQLTGRNVTKLAKALNDNIKAKQETLDILESQANGEIKAQVKTASVAVLGAKVQAEDALNPLDLENEIRDDLKRLFKKRVEDANLAEKALKEIENTVKGLQKNDVASSTPKPTGL